jgi:DNA-binding GntR family transcriptional regulator
MRKSAKLGTFAGATVNRKSLGSQVYEMLETMIIDGTLQPGTRLAEDAIAKQLDVSRSPVREAVNELQRIGLAERSGFHNRRVFIPTVKFVSDLFDIWVSLEATQIYWGSLAATERDIAEIADLLDQMGRALSIKKRYSVLSVKFADRLKYGSSNDLLNSIIDRHQKYLRWIETVYYLEEGHTPRESHPEHVLIFKKFRDKDFAGLFAVVKQHVERQRSRVIQVMTKSSRALVDRRTPRRPGTIRQPVPSVEAVPGIRGRPRRADYR